MTAPEREKGARTRTLKGPRLRTFKLNGKIEPTTFPQFMVEDGVGQFLQGLSTGPPKAGCYITPRIPQAPMKPRELRTQLLQGNVFARGAQESADPRREFWMQFDMNDPNARRDFFSEVRNAISTHQHCFVVEAQLEIERTNKLEAQHEQQLETV